MKVLKAMSVRKVLGLFLFVALTPSIGFGGVIYSQPPAGVLGGYNFTQFRVADDFAIQTAVTVRSIEFWLSTSSVTGLQGFSSLSWAVYTNSGNAPAFPVASGTAVPTVLSAVSAQTFDLFFLPAPFSLSVGTYWLELHDGPTLTSNRDLIATPPFFSWNAAPANTTALVVQDPTSGLPPSTHTIGTIGQVAFQLYDTAIPEPGTLGMMGSALLLALYSRIQALQRDRRRVQLRWFE